ncbi:hypothetical protein Q5530_22960 [Saccharothrix sp. BKS2]|uniref:DUF7919 family protein n=1 Tax=Saccharothrix sp. BKS2 TaxID=3064400 RepID=UPI0039EAF366
MATYEDLTPYEYLTPDEGTGRLVNVGWLGRGSRFGVGAPEPGLVEALLTLAAFRRAHVTRGHHLCELCERHPGQDALRVPFEPAEGGEVSLGNGEVHVPGPGGFVYAAPTLVAHYVDRHGYRPPADFSWNAIAAAKAHISTWEKAKRTLPVGAAVHGEVVERWTSGLVVSTRACPGAEGFVPAELYRPDGAAVAPKDFPRDGAPVEAVVTGHAERGRRILLRVGPA